ncbi:hypothetical protein H0V99_01320 [Candidatus Saccharibacteria bacterium]|nr:hypothetical protein [Candidatus Saccharibacteria bacterium]
MEALHAQENTDMDNETAAEISKRAFLSYRRPQTAKEWEARRHEYMPAPQQVEPATNAFTPTDK